MFQYRERVTPFAAPRHSPWLRGQPSVSIPRKGNPLCGKPAIGFRIEVINVSIPRKGNPLCGWLAKTGKENIVMFQYRERVTPFAASARKYVYVCVGMSFNTAKG